MKKQATKARAFYKFLSDLVTLLMVPAVLLALYACFLMFRSQREGTNVSIFGLSPVRILSTSMTPDYEVNDVVLIKEVNTKSLKKGDIIAFYAYTTGISSTTNPYKFDEYTAPEGITTKSSFSWSKFLGQKNDLQTRAGAAGSKIYFHRITDIRIDEKGNLWFRTKGDSNAGEDSFWTREALVIGKYAPTAGIFNTCLGFLGSNTGIVFLVIVPLGILLIILAIQFIDAYDRYAMEKKIRKDEVKIYDDLCMKKAIGYDLAYDTKLMVLMKEKDNLKRQEAINLMWKKKEAPKPIIKYLKKQDWSIRTTEKNKKQLDALQEKYRKTKNNKYIIEYQKLKDQFEQQSFRQLYNSKGELVESGSLDYLNNLPKERMKELEKEAKDKIKRDRRLLRRNNRIFRRLRKKEEKKEEIKRLKEEVEDNNNRAYNAQFKPDIIKINSSEKTASKKSSKK